MNISEEAAKTIYRRAIESRASDGEGSHWWLEVTDEVKQVVAAKTITVAALIIAWWHHDWAMVNDSPRAAAVRIRRAAKEILGR
ncbi:hypothetical protein [Burkholderia cepacia]|uniref:hypothetical protein n=1 Tax=Burkholderia cepacia TaxID=292 RepID=UPI002AB62C8C|nr:hypothetical protein [Burkholderia cepacia]